MISYESKYVLSGSTLWWMQPETEKVQRDKICEQVALGMSTANQPAEE